EHDDAGQLRHTGTGKTGEVGLDERTGQFAGAVGAEIHEDHRIAVFHTGRGADGGGLDELVALLARIGGVQALHGGGGVEVALALDDQVVGLLDAVPAVVTVHGEVAANQAGDTTLAELGKGGFEQLDGRLGAFWRRVAAVEEGVQVDVCGATAGSRFDHGHQVILMTVHATIGEQPHDVYGLIGGHGLVHGRVDRLIGEEFAVANGLGDAGKVLVHHAAGAEVHVADFGVAHL